MEAIQLSKRLELVASYIKEEARLADIGSDHAYLPCALAQKNKISFAVAGEVVKGPFEKAESEVAYRNLKDKIEVRLGDGLEVVSPDDQIDTITICGMGGALIRDILKRGIAKNVVTRKETLILQPNVGEKTLRTFLMENQYKIVSEKILEENDKIYEIIVAEPVEEQVQYTDKELTFGPFLLEKKTSVFQKKWDQELDKLLYIKNELKKSKEPNNAKLTKLDHGIDQIKEVIG